MAVSDGSENIWNLGTLWNHIWFNDIMKCHYDIIVSWYHSFMISWFGEFGYHSRVILDIIDDFSYMKSLYDFTISLNHIWYHSYETRYDFMIMISYMMSKLWYHILISYIDFIISLNHNMKSYLWKHVWFHDYDFMGLMSWLWFHVWCQAMNSILKSYVWNIFLRARRRALARFQCGFLGVAV